MRSNLVDTLDRLKNATKADAPPILPVLVAHVKEILTVSALDPLLLINLGEAFEDLMGIVQDADLTAGHEGKSQSGTERKSGKGDGSSGKQRTNVAPSQTGTKRSASRGNSRSRGGEQPEINMLEVRAVQKRLTMLMRASDLSTEFQVSIALTLKHA